jgi:hypothetical protein
MEGSRYSEITAASTGKLGTETLTSFHIGEYMSRSSQSYVQLIPIFMAIHQVDRKFVADCVECSSAQLSNFITGKYQPNLDMQKKFRDLLGMPLASEVPGKGPFLQLRSLLLRAMG